MALSQVTLYLYQTTCALFPATNPPCEMAMDCPAEFKTILVTHLTSVWYHRAAVVWGSSGELKFLEKSGPWPEIIYWTARKRKSLLKDSELKGLKVSILLFCSFFLVSAHTTSLQSVFSDYIAELMSLSPCPNVSLLLKISGDLMEYLSSHSWDPSNVLMGTILPSSAVETLTPLPTWSIDSPASSSMSANDSIIILQSTPSPLLPNSCSNLVRVYITDGSFKTIDLKENMSVGRICEKMCKLVRMQGDTGSLWIAKAVTDSGKSSESSIPNRFQLTEVTNTVSF
jgi:hypothetical protein